MRYLNYWDNRNFGGAKSGPLTHASSVKNENDCVYNLKYNVYNIHIKYYFFY